MKNANKPKTFQISIVIIVYPTTNDDISVTVKVVSRPTDNSVIFCLLQVVFTMTRPLVFKKKKSLLAS